MGGFQVVNKRFRPLWVPVHQNSGGNVYVGQIVTMGFTAAGYGAKPLGAASGVGAITSDLVPWGVVTAINDKTEAFSTTYNSAYTTGVQSQAAQVARILSPGFVLQEGMGKKSDPMPWVQIDLLDQQSVLKGRIFKSTYGTAVDKLANTTQSTTGALVVTSAIASITPTAYNKILYCVTGKNAGLYRGSGNETSTTNHVPDTYWPYDVEVGDYFKVATISLGTVKAQFDTYSTFIDGVAEYGSNCYILDVLEINLEKDGEEYALFRFNPFTFNGLRYNQ